MNIWYLNTNWEVSYLSEPTPFLDLTLCIFKESTLTHQMMKELISAVQGIGSKIEKVSIYVKTDFCKRTSGLWIIQTKDQRLPKYLIPTTIVFLF